MAAREMLEKQIEQLEHRMPSMNKAVAKETARLIRRTRALWARADYLKNQGNDALAEAYSIHGVCVYCDLQGSRRGCQCGGLSKCSPAL
jgi:hypothetical protein